MTIYSLEYTVYSPIWKTIFDGEPRKGHFLLEYKDTMRNPKLVVPEDFY